MRLKIEICLDNAAFHDALACGVDPTLYEINKIIQRQVLPMLSAGESCLHLLDSNGNSVGTAQVVED